MISLKELYGEQLFYSDIQNALSDDIANLYQNIDEEFIDELREALEDKDKWEEFKQKHNVDYNPTKKVDDEVECVSVIKFNSAEEQDEFYLKEGKITKEEKVEEEEED